ncbi:hypothetical protein JOE11_005563 [Robbsia andropogonis]|uniref:hypothetical protein n=1 Tax=Robbsia andropogonis TaxID=28092 RepID=UPI003D235448
MTVDELRQALKDLPADLSICVSYPDLQNEGFAYETRDICVAGENDSGAGEGKRCFLLEAFGGI